VIVEDSPSDAELMQRVLAASGLALESTVVGTEPELAAALREFRPDAVLTDNALPRFSGRLALQITHAHDPSLPVIMVSGTAREDDMVQLLREGLADYILKDSLLRLPAALHDALELAEVQRARARDRDALEASERRFRAVAEASGDGLLIAADTGVVVYANAAAGNLFRCDPGEITGRPLSSVLPSCPMCARGAVPPGAVWQAPGASSSGLAAPVTAEVTASRYTGERMQLDLTASFWEEEGRWFTSVQLRDVTARDLEARTRRVLSQVVEQATNSVIITDTTGAIEYVNPAFERLTGYHAIDVIGQTPRVLKSGLQAPDVYVRLWEEITRGQPFSTEFSNRRKDGSIYTQQTTVFPILDDEGRAVRFVGLGVDVTQERLLERQLRQAQKMEMVGQLAGGIAHDFNNTLTGVMVNAALLEEMLPAEHGEQRELVQAVLAAAQRGADLVKRLMTLSRGRSGPDRRVDIHEAVDEAGRTARRILPENIEIVTVHDGDAVDAQLDDGALHQALLNLCNNARDAMPQGGRLTLATRVERTHAVIEVADTGSGMAPDVLARVFEPFFTTKEAGKGTGLGLPMVYGFAQHCGGSVDIESALGAGTRVRLRLPRAASASATEATGGAATAPLAGAPRAAAARAARAARATILLVEDQDDLRDVARRVLERLGHRVYSAGDGTTAFELLTKHRGALDLVLADFVLPHGGGEQLYHRSLDWNDRPRFLFTSGYTPSDLEVGRTLLQTVPFLPKPWSVAQLESAVASALSQEKS
jgi:PAS domain S-box-containing protein